MRRSTVYLPTLALLAVAASFVSCTSLSAQERMRLSAGDSIRVDQEIVGRVLNINGPVMTLVSRAAPRCRAGEMHGDAPICDPAPLIRHTLNLSEVVIERRSEKPHLMLRTVGGGLLGAGAFGAAGYFLGPHVGFGKVQGCLAGEANFTCRAGEPRYTQEELDARQEAADRKKGAFFFGVLGGTGTAILVNRLSKGWVRIEPIFSAGDDPWAVSFTVPTPR
ncbi:MAG: hypothetical protein R3253_16135 [Longimicrobiales bacterium]|nr:hypothetical protein [Longimicrobiales bacterium]